MKVTLILVGKTNDDYLKIGIQKYIDRLKFYCQFSIVEIPELKVSNKLSTDEIKKKEGELIRAKIPQNCTVFLLDENGKEYSSRQFSQLIQKSMNDSAKELCFVIGGAYGFSPEIYALAPAKISFSKMTFSHQMIRLFLVEQMYRGFAIINNLPYHHD